MRTAGEQTSFSSSKETKKEDPQHYRPNSFTYNPGKVIEQLILESISRHMNKKVTRSSQHRLTR